MVRTWLVALAAVLVLTSCSEGADHRAGSPRATPSDASGRHNVNDAAFLRLEIVHHGQAIELAELALRQSQNARLRSLARQIESVQASELTIMHRRLRAWHAETDGDGHTHVPPGNLTASEMASLRAVKGLEFDRYWAQMMTFHEMATSEMAGVEQQQGIHPETRSLARALDSAQDRLVNQLLDLLKTFPK
jgi:uncharacterized protein (DUF305 family)